ncbi:MAG: hypothetical protein WA047_01840 [Phenylobacterium sp.]|uniref:hypothetical protein n=1 Tax=Phenylobacterium sp. TaxID=1871053 RepID=UPI003BB78F53
MLRFPTQGRPQDEVQMPVGEDGPQTLHQGRVGRGFQMASGGSVGQPGNPFPASTVKMQAPFFRAAGLDLAAEVPGLVWGTINVELGYGLRRATPDITVTDVDWTDGLTGAGRIAPETFSFVRCRLIHAGRDYPGLIYLPHPETKPPTNAHRYDILEVLTCRVEGLADGQPVAVLCRADAFEPMAPL